jgi:succinyl-diaminopimelate desuccinylase
MKKGTTMATITDITTEELLSQADAFIDAHWEEIVREIVTLVAVPSIVDFTRATAEDPSGPEAHEGLRASVDLAQRLGFNAWDDAGEIGIADLEGERDEQLAMICHADVVTPGVGWTSDPWTLERREGFLIGRGVIDDKGPLVISLYCMKFFQEWCEKTGARLPYTLRMLMGTNEETGTMRDVRYYLEHYPAPAFLFTPDNAFPACYGEKGQFDCAIMSPAIIDGRIVDFTTGDSSTNAVPSQATLVVYADVANLPAAEGIEIADAGDGCARLVATGRGGHASLPEGTVNAIDMLVKYALANGLCNPAEEAYLRMIGRIMDSTDGSSIGVDSRDEYFGGLTCIVGTIHCEQGRMRITIDIRYPTSTTGEELLAKFQALTAEAGATVELTGGLPPFLTKPDSPAIQALAAAYREATGFDGEPFTIGGGTYAREFPCAASFGPEDPHDAYPDWVGPMHGADEGVSEESLKRAMRVYILTIARLMALDLAKLSK